MSASEFSAESGCSAATDAATRKRGVQPAALIARILEDNWHYVNSWWPPNLWRAEGMLRAIELIRSEARDAERDAAG